MSDPNSSPNYRDFYRQMSQMKIIPVSSQPDIQDIKPKPRSILRTTLQVYVGEPAWAFVGNDDEEDRLINMLRRAGIELTISYVGRKVLIELELKWKDSDPQNYGPGDR